MELAELEALLDQVPLLATQPRELEKLSGGLTNTNVKVTTPDGTYVARISGGNAEALGIDRDREHANTVAAAEAGVGAPVHDYRPDLGVLVIGYLEGRTLHDPDVRRPEMLPRVARACRTLHEGPAFTGVFDIFERQRSYLATITERGYRLPVDYADHAEAFATIRRALAVRDEGLVPCNNDLLAENFVDDGQKVWLIDYEYAGMNDPCFELGNTACECGLDADQLETLVTSYYGRHRPSRIARARLQGAVGQYGWTLWGVIQSEVSPLDFDFWGWGVERYEAAARLFTSDQLPALLDDARRED